MKIFILLLLIFCTTTPQSSLLGKSQRKIDKALFVIEKNKINKLYTFGHWSQNEEMEHSFKYLGKVCTKKGHIYKILNMEWTWGLSGRVTSRILVYDNKNRFVGNYYLQMNYELPVGLVGNKLIFIIKSEDCDSNKKTVIDLSNGLPKQILIKCKEEFGSIAVFE